MTVCDSKCCQLHFIHRKLVNYCVRMLRVSRIFGQEFNSPHLHQRNLRHWSMKPDKGGCRCCWRFADLWFQTLVALGEKNYLLRRTHLNSVPLLTVNGVQRTAYIAALKFLCGQDFIEIVSGNKFRKVATLYLFVDRDTSMCAASNNAGRV